MDVFRYFATRHPKSLQNIRNLLIINDDNLIQQKDDEVRKDGLGEVVCISTEMQITAERSEPGDSVLTITL